MTAKLINAGNKMAALIQDEKLLVEWRYAVAIFRSYKKNRPKTKLKDRYAARSKAAYEFLEANPKRMQGPVAKELGITVYEAGGLLRKMAKEGRLNEFRDKTEKKLGKRYYTVVPVK